MTYEEHISGIVEESSRLVEFARASDPALAIPTCPAWDVDELVNHVALFQGFGEGLVRERATRRMGFKELGLTRERRGVDGVVASSARLVATLEGANEDEPMWSWAGDQRVGFWARRMHHETLVHRVDLEIARGEDPRVEATTAGDGVDELLTNLMFAGSFSPDLALLTGGGEALAIRSPERAWRIDFHPDGFMVSDDDGPAEATLTGSNRDLLLVLYRRRPLGDSGCVVEGDATLVTRWLSHSALL